MIKISHLRDLFVTDNIGAVFARGHSGIIVAITHMGKKNMHWVELDRWPPDGVWATSWYVGFVCT